MPFVRWCGRVDKAAYRRNAPEAWRRLKMEIVRYEENEREAVHVFNMLVGVCVK